MANASFPDLRLQLISPVVNLYQSPTHDPLALCVIPAGLPFLRHRNEKGKESQESTSTSRQTTKDDSIIENTIQARDRGITKTQAGAKSVDRTRDEPVSLLPPDEPPVQTKASQEGKVKKYAGTVTLVHVPSLPIRLPSRFPLDKQSATPGETQASLTTEAEEPAVSGISEWNLGLIERDTPPPITGWALDVPLDEQDLIFESAPDFTPAYAGSEEDDRMQIDSPTGAERLGASRSKDNRKGKGRGENSQGVKDEDEEPIRVRVQTAAMGMDGKAIVVLGTRGRIWVYRIKNG